jgi:hypothetical protein
LTCKLLNFLNFPLGFSKGVHFGSVSAYDRVVFQASLEVPMVVLKVLALAAAAALSLMAMRFMLREVQAVKVKANDRRPQDGRRLRRLRQDPRTGVYYPEE